MRQKPAEVGNGDLTRNPLQPWISESPQDCHDAETSGEAGARQAGNIALQSTQAIIHMTALHPLRPILGWIS